MKIIYVNRSLSRKAFSIEKVFGIIANQLSRDCEVKTVSLQSPKASLKGVFSNWFSFNETYDLIHVTGDVHYMSILRFKSVLTIHDVQSALQGSLIKRLLIIFFWIKLPVFFAKRVTVVSEFTKSELKEYVRWRKKIVVIPNPVDEKYKLQIKKFNSVKPQILLVGTKTNKNLIRTILALRDIYCDVVIIGTLNREQLNLLKLCRISYENFVDIGEEELLKAYEGCDLLCFASTYEGFGMPIIEAQAVGRPVITSDLGSMKDVAGNGALKVDPFSVDSIRKGVEDLIRDKNLRNTLVRNGLENVKRFHPKVISQQYFDLYKEILLN